MRSAACLLALTLATFAHAQPPARVPGWAVIDEAPEPVAPELRQQGLLRTAGRRYTRADGPNSEVCAVEVWYFTDAAIAERVAAKLSLPGWRIEIEGPAIVLTHGVRMTLGQRARAGVSDDCAAVARRTRAGLQSGSTRQR